jgi:ribonuclease BN (tRNA processing enzyme)
LLEDLIEAAKEKGISSTSDLLAAAQKREITQPMTFGGNTSCTQVTHGDHTFYVDMGSGFREAGTEAMKQGIKEFHVFMTHMHWDHVMGLPFFIPVHVPGHKINIYHVHKNCPEYVRINFNGVNFPLTWDQVAADVEFHQLKLYEPTQFTDVSVTPFSLDHPGGSFGFRFDAGGKSFVIGVDGEYKRLTPKELGKDHSFYQNLDVLLFDAQYEMAELASRFDWGHCSPNIGIDLALREGIKNLIFTHHDPWSTETKLRRMYLAAEKYMKGQLDSYKEQWVDQPEGPKMMMAYDGLMVEL